MTEIPEHLRKRAEEARQKAEAARRASGDAPSCCAFARICSLAVRSTINSGFLRISVPSPCAVSGTVSPSFGVRSASAFARPSPA